uniref:Tail protein n=1 Tax=viral metagenome TaxID=1070528 RepID=A0A6M3IGS8_9ZZZZ
MAITKHTQGKFSVNTTQLTNAVDATVTINVNNADVTPIGTSWETVLVLHKGWEMNVSANYDAADTAQAAIITAFTTGASTFTSLTLYEDGTGNYVGSGIVTSASVTKSVGSPDKFTASFKGTGTLSHT